METNQNKYGDITMGQREVIQFLKEKYEKGIMKYYSVTELKEHIEGGVSVSCTKLRRKGMIDFDTSISKGEKGTNYRKMVYRYKPE